MKLFNYFQRRKLTFTFSFFQTPESGFSMISVLIIMGVVLSAVLIISQSRVNSQNTQKAIKIKQSYADASQALISDLVTRVHANLGGAAPCLNLALMKNTVSPVYDKTTSITTSVGAPPMHVQAATRCAASRVPTNGLNAADNKFYFCIALAKDLSAPPDSILNAKVAFAEVAIELVDLPTQQAISCSQYQARSTDINGDGSAGMAVTMGLYWEVGIPGKSIFSHKAISYVANQNN